MPKTHLSYSDEFRQEAVNRLLTSGHSLKQVAAELGVSANSLRSWRNRAIGQGRVAEATSTNMD